MTIFSVALAAHVLISAMIIGLVLLQRGKGAEAGAGFGAGASGTVFGAKGSANFLTRSTAIMATLFFMSSLGLAYLGASRPVAESLMDEGEPAAVEVIGTLPVEEGDVTADGLPDLPDFEAQADEESLLPGSTEE